MLYGTGYKSLMFVCLDRFLALYFEFLSHLPINTIVFSVLKTLFVLFNSKYSFIFFMFCGKFTTTMSDSSNMLLVMLSSGLPLISTNTKL